VEHARRITGTRGHEDVKKISVCGGLESKHPDVEPFFHYSSKNTKTTQLYSCKRNEIAMKKKWNCNEKEMKLQWKRNEIAMKKKWNCNEKEMKLQWKSNEIAMKKQWNCNEKAMKLQWKSNEIAMKKQW
jgi:hypothetical protein